MQKHKDELRNDWEAQRERAMRVMKREFVHSVLRATSVDKSIYVMQRDAINAAWARTDLLSSTLEKLFNEIDWSSNAKY